MKISKAAIRAWKNGDIHSHSYACAMGDCGLCEGKDYCVAAVIEIQHAIDVAVKKAMKKGKA